MSGARRGLRSGAGLLGLQQGHFARPELPMNTITSRDNRWLKAFRSALRGKGPDLRADEPIGIEGPKLVEEAIRSGLETEALLVSESGESDAESILHAASQSEAGISQSRILRTSDKLFQSVSGTETPQGVAGLFRPRQWTLEDVLRGPAATRAAEPLVIVLAAIQDPGNVGTILRSAEAFGATGAIATRGTADPWSPKALRASAGSALRLPLLRGMAIPIVLAQLRIKGLRIYAASAGQNGHADIHDVADLREPAGIFIGNEGTGLPAEVIRAADAKISIPTGAVESLNAGVAASIVLYEAARQRSEIAKAKAKA